MFKSKLVLTAGLIGIGGSLACIGILTTKQYQVLRAPYCVQAMKHLENNYRAIDLIGQPINLQKPDLVDQSLHRFETNFTQLTVPFKGTKDSGTMRIEADRPSPNHDWSVGLVELKLKSLPNKLLIAYRRKKDEFTPPLDDTNFDENPIKDNKTELVW